jgi:hypothetical protein
VSVKHDLFGVTVVVSVRGQPESAITFHVADEDHEAASVLAARLRALAEMGGSAREASSFWLPVETSVVKALFNEHKAAFLECVSQYRRERDVIDAILEATLS